LPVWQGGESTYAVQVPTPTSIVEIKVHKRAVLSQSGIKLYSGTYCYQYPVDNMDLSRIDEGIITIPSLTLQDFINNRIPVDVTGADRKITKYETTFFYKGEEQKLQRVAEDGTVVIKGISEDKVVGARHDSNSANYIPVIPESLQTLVDGVRTGSEANSVWSNNQEIILDYGADEDIGINTFILRKHGTNKAWPSNIKIEGKKLNGDWIDFGAVEKADSRGDNVIIYETFQNMQNIRFIKFTNVGSDTEISEIENSYNSALESNYTCTFTVNPDFVDDITTIHNVEASDSREIVINSPSLIDTRNIEIIFTTDQVVFDSYTKFHLFQFLSRCLQQSV
jgi:hypothetical protein